MKTTVLAFVDRENTSMGMRIAFSGGIHADTD